MHRIRTTPDLTILSCPWAADDPHRVNPKASLHLVPLIKFKLKTIDTSIY
jgi:hypothetical protein